MDFFINHERNDIDYKWFPQYPIDRQIIQNNIVKGIIGGHLPVSRPWAVYTCGIFGSGKSHTLRLMNESGLFNTSSFVKIDPDAIKYKLPEFQELLKENPKTASSIVHKESTFIALLAEKVAIAERLNYIVDGSLQNSDWYINWFNYIHYRNYNIVIIKVEVTFDVAWERCEKRSRETGRHIDKEHLKSVYDKVPESFEILKKIADLHVIIDNDKIPSIITMGVD